MLQDTLSILPWLGLGNSSWLMHQHILQDRCRRKLAPRADITSADKVFMFNWNCHLRTNPIHADWQVRPEAFGVNSFMLNAPEVSPDTVWSIHCTSLRIHERALE